MSPDPLSRRNLLAFAAATVAAAPLLNACGTQPSPPPAPVAEPTPARAPQPGPTIQREVVRSKHRGTDVELALTYPSGVRSLEGLPLVLYLHGRDGLRPNAMPANTLTALEAEHRAGTTPAFGLVSVDGGYNSYWFDGSANGDVLSMLLEELPSWLRERGYGAGDGQPFAVGGISSGGFGALHYAIARSRLGSPVEGVGVLAPALTTSWAHAEEREAFADQQQWHRVDPLEHIDDLGGVPLGVWVGDVDPFFEGAEQLAHDHPNTRVFSVLPGGHEGKVFDAVGTDMVRYFANLAPERI